MAIRKIKPQWSRDESGRYYKQAAFQSKANFHTVAEDHNHRYVADKFRIPIETVQLAYNYTPNLHNLPDDQQKQILIQTLGLCFKQAKTKAQLTQLKQEHGDIMTASAWKQLPLHDRKTIHNLCNH